MTNPTAAQSDELQALLARTQSWIDSLQIAGLSENVIVAGIHTALVERSLRAGGVEKTCQWLQGQADMVHTLGHQLLAEINRQGR